MSNIFVTGSLGFVGQHLVKKLVADGHKVSGCDLYHDESEAGFLCNDAPFNQTYYRADVAQYRQLERAWRASGSAEIVYHLAAEFGRWNGEDFYEQLWTTNAIGTKNIIRLQEQHGFRLVHFSSSEVYGDFPDLMAESVMDRNAVPQMNDYAMSKWVNELQIRNSAAKHQTQSVIVRLFNTYGPGERYSPYRSANCRFLYCALRGVAWRLYRGHSRTSSYIDDTVRTLAAIASSFRPGQVYNICGKTEHTVEELSAAVVKVSGCDPSLAVLVEPEPMTTRRKQPCAERAIADLGHNPQVNLLEGISRTWEWMKQEYQK